MNVRTSVPGIRGFTLIEIVMVMAVIGLLAALAIPKINFQSYRVNGAVRGLNGLMSRAQRIAVTNQANVNVLFDVSDNGVRIHEDDNNNNVIDPGERVRRYPLGEGIVYGLGGAPVRQYGAPVSFTRRLSGVQEVIFRRDGSASENGGIYVTTTGAATSARPGDARSLEVIRATGRTEWYRYSGSQWERKF